MQKSGGITLFSLSTKDLLMTILNTFELSSPISSVYFCLGVEIASDFSYRRCELISYACPWGPEVRCTCPKSNE